ncbi:radical SAM protein [Methanobrevibacter sp.]|uniref:radical SAM protein n=1 Tax=Methanobrevibacter sp. TaxID=66852 RepID=UPI00388FC084
MHYTGPVYRPPPEADTPLLEVTYGCSWEKCSFCTMYHSQKFGVSPLEDVEEDLKELSRYYPKDLKKIFLVNGDAFALPARKLLEIADLIHKYFPEIECIACYASIRNIKRKSIDDLKNLRKAGYNRLYIGLETAYEPTLEQMQKGYTKEDEYHELSRLKEVDMNYVALLMLGVAGRGNCIESAKQTAELLNEYKPVMIIPTSTSLEENTPLYDMTLNGEFVEATERELIEEELTLIENLEMDDDCFFFGAHVHNLIRINYYFKFKEEMIKDIKRQVERIEEIRPGFLDTVAKRGHL